MKFLFLIFGLFCLGIANAGGFSLAAVPSKVDIIPGGGFVVFGAFGNAGGCTQSNHLYVKGDHPQYKQMYAAALAAFVSGNKIYGYVHTCEPIGWYSVPETTYNVVTANGSFAVSN